MKMRKSEGERITDHARGTVGMDETERIRNDIKCADVNSTNHNNMPLEIRYTEGIEEFIDYM